jgi:DHA2 family multidrug resistance protein
LSIAEIVRATGANYSRMTEMISPYNTTLSLPWVTGAWDFGSVAGLAKVAKEINRQAAMIGYLNAFVMYAVASGLGLLLVLIVRRRKSALARA